VYTQLVKNVTIALDDGLLSQTREFARAQGKSFNELVSEVLSRTVGDHAGSMAKFFEEADGLDLKLVGPIPSREERNAR
jgi:hypothetical protein